MPNYWIPPVSIKQHNNYQVVNDMHYTKETSRRVIEILEGNRLYNTPAKKLVLEYGDPRSGQSWGVVDAGKVYGLHKPMIKNGRARSQAVMDQAIVRITTDNMIVLYEHPEYTPYTCPDCYTEHNKNQPCPI